MLLNLIGCAGSSSTGVMLGCGWSPDPEIHGAHLDNESSATWAQDPDLKDHIRRTIEAGADYWGVPYSALYGWKIQIVDGQPTCYGAASSGCVQWWDMTVKISADPAFYFELTKLVHEMGHVVMPFGDPGHFAEQWWDSEALAQTYAELVPMDPVHIGSGVWTHRRPYLNQYRP